MIIAVDFDGTIVEHKYPDVGAPVPGAIEWMKRWHAAGAKLILWTMRSGPELERAVDYCRSNGVEFCGVNGNPEQSSWTRSPKCYAHIYVDDAAFGCPLRESRSSGRRDMVDWEKVGPVILERLSR